MMLKDAVIEIRDIIFNEVEIDIQQYIEDVSKRSKLNFDDVKDLFNIISMWKLAEQNPRVSKSNKKIWSKGEDQLLLKYEELTVKHCLNNGVKLSKEAMFEQLSDIIPDRTQASIAFKFYEVKRSVDKDISDLISRQPQKNTVECSNDNNDDDDVLDVVIELVENLEKVNVSVESLFKDLLTMSRSAVQNNNIEKVEELEGKVEFLEQELEKEKKYNENLQSEVSKIVSDFQKLRSEVDYFNNLNGKEKLQQLNNFNRNIKYIVDKFGGVVKVQDVISK